MISNPFPTNVGFACVNLEEVNDRMLLPEERTQLSERARPKRINDFTGGRVAARKALAELGHLESTGLLTSESRMPIWPKGFLGSISHSGSIALACAARKSEMLALGIDAELLTKEIDMGVFSKIINAAEWQAMDQLNLEKQVQGLIAFSAKETIYKTFYPLLEIYFGFDAVEIMSVSDEALKIIPKFPPLAAIAPKCIAVNFLIQDNYALTYCSIPKD